MCIRDSNDWQLAQVNLEETRRKLHDQIAQAVMDAEGYAKESVSYTHLDVYKRQASATTCS